MSLACALQLLRAGVPCAGVCVAAPAQRLEQPARTPAACSRQFPSLLCGFDMRAFITPVQDRTPFTEKVCSTEPCREQGSGPWPGRGCGLRNAYV